MQTFQEYLAKVFNDSHIPITDRDPLVALYYLLLTFENDFTEFMSDQRRQMQSVLEQEQQKWQEQSKARAEAILERSLEIARDQSNERFTSQAELICQKINEIFDTRMGELKVIDARLGMLGKLNLLCTGGLILFFCVMLIFF